MADSNGCSWRYDHGDPRNGQCRSLTIFIGRSKTDVAMVSDWIWMSGCQAREDCL